MNFFCYVNLNKLIGDIIHYSICKVLEARVQLDEERAEQLTNQLKESRMFGEDADSKSDELSQKLVLVENDWEIAEERAKFGHSKVQELDEELQVSYFYIFIFFDFFDLISNRLSFRSSVTL